MSLAGKLRAEQVPDSRQREDDAVVIEGTGLRIADIARVAAGGRVHLSDSPEARRRMEASRACILAAVQNGTPVYGVSTRFGGLADTVLPKETAAALQQNLIWSHKAGTGDKLPVADVRAAMLLRANSLAQGISGVRPEIIERFEIFLNAGATPQVYEFGSIGASGDLVPLAYIAGALIGLDAQYLLDWRGEEVDSLTVLERLGLPRLTLAPKEGLALINGTSVMAGVAANCVVRFRSLIAMALGTHALMLQGLGATNQSFHPFIHSHKPHPGQVWVADQVLRLLADSQLARDESVGQRDHCTGDLIQDRYSLRCIPQYLGPLIDGLSHLTDQVEVEANSVTDNPLIDADHDAIYHCGNFLGQYIGIAMDQLRYYVGLLSKHLDVQIALLVHPEFSNGLPASLVGNEQREINVGLKALQLTANSLMPMLGFLGNSLVDRFPTHAEQFNQNINSQGFGSANLARRSLDVLEQYMAVALMFGVQAVDLRTYLLHGHYDTRRVLSPSTVLLYEAVREVSGGLGCPDRPYVLDDHEQFLDVYLSRLVSDIASGEESRIGGALLQTTAALARHRAAAPPCQDPASSTGGSPS